MFDLKGKVAIITGGASGIGEAAVRLFHRLGARVVIGDIQDDRGNALAGELGSNAAFIHLDVSDSDNWKRAIEEAEAAFGPVNVLVNNAGHPGFQKSVGDLSIEEFRRVGAINQEGTFLGMHHVLPSMARAGGGAIVNNSSAWGLVGAANNIDYCATKWAITGMTKAAAVELASSNVRVNSVHPGLALTPMVEENLKMLGAAADPFIAKMPLNRPAKPEEIANVFAFLASDASSFVTGLAFAADGGLTAQ